MCFQKSHKYGASFKFPLKYPDHGTKVNGTGYIIIIENLHPSLYLHFNWT